MRNWIIGAVLVLAGAAAYYYFGVYQKAEHAPAQDPVAIVQPAAPPAEPTEIQQPAAAAEPEPSIERVSPPAVDEIPLPMLMESDPTALGMLAELIGQPAVMRYIVNDNVISRIVATVDTLGSRQIPGVVQAVNGPESNFVVIVNNQPEIVIRNEEGDPVPQFVIDPGNYKRYNPYIELLEAADTAQLVNLYRSHYSLFQEAFSQMGYSDGDFNARLIAIIDELLATPEIVGPVNLVKPEAFFLYTDPDLESRSAGQKILLRMGNGNAARVKSKLAEIREAL